MPIPTATRGSRPSAGAALAVRPVGTPPPAPAGGQPGTPGFVEGQHPRAQQGAASGQFVRKGQGMTGQPDQQVADVQQAVNAYPNAQHVAVDGRFGPVTEDAVKTFQRSQGINANGIVDPTTYEAMLNPAPLTADQANAQIDQQLNPPKAGGGSSGSRQAGGAPGPGGGSGASSPPKGSSASLDPSSTSSVEDFQRANGLKVDGIIGPDTQRALRRVREAEKQAKATVRSQAKASGQLTEIERQRLQELGYDTDESGLRKLQQQYGLQPTGKLDQATRRLLNRQGSRVRSEQKGIARGKVPRGGLTLAEGLARAAATHHIEEQSMSTIAEGLARAAETHTRLQEAGSYSEQLHPRARDGKFLRKMAVGLPQADQSRLRTAASNLDRYGKIKAHGADPLDGLSATAKAKLPTKGAAPEPKAGTPEFDAAQKRSQSKRGARYGMPPEASTPTPHDGIEVGSHWQVNGRGSEGGHYEVTQSAKADPHVEIKSLRSGKTQSIDHSDLRKNFTKADHPAGTYVKLKGESTRGIVRKVDRGVHHVELEGDVSALHRYSAHELEPLPKGGKLAPKKGSKMQEAGTKPEPFSHSKTSNWVARAGGLPTYIQHVAHDIIESGSITDTSHAIATAISQAKKNAAKGNKQAAAAVAQWEAMKSKKGGKVAEAEIRVVEAMLRAIEISERLQEAQTGLETTRARAAQRVARDKLQEALGLADAEGTDEVGDDEIESQEEEAAEGEGEVRPASTWEQVIGSLNPGSMLRIADYAVTRLADGDGFAVEDLDGGLAQKVASAAEAVSLMRADETDDEREINESLFTEHMHPRDRLGKFMAKVGAAQDHRGGRALATLGGQIPHREVGRGGSLGSGVGGSKLLASMRSPGGHDDGNKGTPRGSESHPGSTGSTRPTSGGTTGQSTGAKPAWDTEANFKAFQSENLRRGIAPEKLTRMDFQRIMVKHDTFLAERGAALDSASQSHNAAHQNWESERKRVYNEAFRKAYRPDPADTSDGMGPESSSSPQQQRARAAAQLAVVDWEKGNPKEPAGFHDKVSGLDAGQAVTLPGGTRVRRLIPTSRKPYPTFEVRSGGKRVTRLNPKQAASVALSFDRRAR
jgi:peptidoglycan hydrolase-like protein with peptidoglycan-binding domain